MISTCPTLSSSSSELYPRKIPTKIIRPAASKRRTSQMNRKLNMVPALAKLIFHIYIFAHTHKTIRKV